MCACCCRCDLTLQSRKCPTYYPNINKVVYQIIIIAMMLLLYAIYLAPFDDARIPTYYPNINKVVYQIIIIDMMLLLYAISRSL